ncbi:hypothetical protein F5146DRAFT_1104605 [Armillaria mellea]|nr:hypothetical protein F5146DRAFT_1104605 [Armillaria mellea]
MGSESSMRVEDLLNKPWQCIVAGRISCSRAVFLQWGLAITCLFLSYLFSIVWPGVMLAFGIRINNKLGSMATTLRYYSFESGACTIISGMYLWLDTHEVLGDFITEALLWVTLIVLTTIYAQDFQDVLGYCIQGCKMLPIIAPVGSRISMILLLLMWSMWLGPISTALSQGFLLSTAIVVGGHFMLFCTVSADCLSYILYNMRCFWLSSAQIQLFHHA